MDNVDIQLAELQHERDALISVIRKMRARPPRTLSPEEVAARTKARQARLDEVRARIRSLRHGKNIVLQTDAAIPPTRRALAQKIRRYRDRVYHYRRVRREGKDLTDRQRGILRATVRALHDLDRARRERYPDTRACAVHDPVAAPATSLEEVRRRIASCRSSISRIKKRPPAQRPPDSRERLRSLEATLRALVAQRTALGWVSRKGRHSKRPAQ